MATPTNVPKWWLDEVEAVLAAKSWKPADLAAKIAGSRDAESFSAAKSRISRFLNRENTTIETAEEIRAAIKDEFDIELRPFVFDAATPEQSDAFRLLQSNAARLRRALLVDQLLSAAEGEEQLQALLAKLSPPQGDSSEAGGQVTPLRPKPGRQ